MYSHNETRNSTRLQLMAYIKTSFVNQLIEELDKYNSEKYHLSFEVVENKWSVVTDVKIKYSNQGWIQHDDKENVEHIELGILLGVNEKLAGDFLIKFSSDKGFYNLEECVKTAISNLDLNELPESKSVKPQFYVKNIFNEQLVTPETIDNDPRILDIMAALTGMNFSKRKSLEWAREIIMMHPDIHSIDDLVEEILQMVDKKINDK